MHAGSDLIYSLLHNDYAESFSAYAPRTEDFYDFVRSRLPDGWSIRRKDIWFHCGPVSPNLPSQGWKIHVSSTLTRSQETLERVIAVLFKYSDVAFKFCLDRAVLSLLNGKNWPRSGSGKFITIYPSNSSRFIELIEEIHQATLGIPGPYILSDRRYKGSRVVFYRYGGILPHTSVNYSGERVPRLQSPDGVLVPDQRLAYPATPAWAAPVLPQENVQDDEDENPTTLTLLDGRYTIEQAVSFSNAGGVYYALDNHTGAKVVIKEARPCINAMTDDYDAVDLLKKEHRLLTVVADTGIAPQPLNLFEEWEHWFLVEEYIEGSTMGHHSAASNVLLRTRMTEAECRDWNQMFVRLCANVLRIIKILHSRNIVFSDLSPNNLIVSGDNQELKIIDFEGAYQPNVDRPLHVYTPGFASPHRVAGGQARIEDDYYSVGAVLLAYLLPINGLLHLNPGARHDFLASIQQDIHLPVSVIDLINQLMDNATPVICEQTTNVEVQEVVSPVAPAALLQASADYRTVVQDIVRHLKEVADYQRDDRLHPADPAVFETNPLSLAYGAAGISYTLKKVTGQAPQAALEWMLRHKINPGEYPCGLYIGLSGIAWSLLELGAREPAEKIFRSTFNHPLLLSCADLFHGIAGWGMTALRLFEATGNELYLDKTRDAGDNLLASCRKSERGYYWSESDEQAIGLAHGSSGVALFLLYLYLATGDEKYFAAGVRALDFDLAAAVSTKDGGLSWGKSVGSPSPVYSYWRFGSAGIGIATARFQRLRGSSRYHSILERIFIDTDRKYAVFPGQFAGLAGAGGFLLDMFDLTGEQRFLESARKVAQGIMHFRVERNGAAFPGEMSSRLSCDYGTGSAGIALFLDRLVRRQKNDFMLDELFESSPCTRVARGLSSRAVACGGAAA